MPQNAFRQGFLAGWSSIRGDEPAPILPAFSAEPGRDPYRAGIARGVKEAQAEPAASDAGTLDTWIDGALRRPLSSKPAPSGSHFEPPGLTHLACVSECEDRPARPGSACRDRTATRNRTKRIPQPAWSTTRGSTGSGPVCTYCAQGYIRAAATASSPGDTLNQPCKVISQGRLLAAIEQLPAHDKPGPGQLTTPGRGAHGIKRDCPAFQQL
jgi:hypothetical protein